MLPYLKKKSSTTDHGLVRHCPTMDGRFINTKQILKENGLWLRQNAWQNIINTFTLIIHFGLYDLFILWGKSNYVEGKIVHNGEHRSKGLNLKIGRQRHFICSTGPPPPVVRVTCTLIVGSRNCTQLITPLLYVIVLITGETLHSPPHSSQKGEKYLPAPAPPSTLRTERSEAKGGLQTEGRTDRDRAFTEAKWDTERFRDRSGHRIGRES